MRSLGLIIATIALLAGCGSVPDYPPYVTSRAYSPAPSSGISSPNMTPIPPQSRPRSVRPQSSQPAYQSPFLSDTVTFSQKDPRWGQDRLGLRGGSLAREGCVITSAAMAMTNSGFSIDPGELNRRLTHSDNLTPSGLLKWKGISEVSGGRVKATFYDTVSEPLIQSCLVKGDYPLVRFYLPNGRSHWAMILGRSSRGYHMRDPLKPSAKPLIFPRDSSAFKSLRCIGPR